MYPAWGGDDGGVCQGVSYWGGVTKRGLIAGDIIEGVLGINIYNKIFFKNTGFFKLYAHSPFNKMSHFGDVMSSSLNGPSGKDKQIMERLASTYKNSYFKWYADMIPTTGIQRHTYYIDEIIEYLWRDKSVLPQSPHDLPQSKYFADVGWVTMHSDMTNPMDVMLVLKSSPYGSHNHSHADQNSFVLYAYGEPLFIDSGFYDSYLGGHHRSWTTQTVAHNALTVGDRGQPIQDKRAEGSVEEFFSSDYFDYAIADASKAYQSLLKSFNRHILFYKPSFLIIFDDIESLKKEFFQWHFHTLRAMKFNEPWGSALLEIGQAKVLLDGICSLKLASVHDYFLNLALMWPKTTV